MTQPPDDAALVARLREESQQLQSVAWSRSDGGQDCSISAALAAEAATALEAKDRRIAEMEAALRRSGVALDDWLHTYADDLCDPAVVEASRQRIGQCGMLAYIAEVQQQNRAALEPSDKGVG